MKTTRYISVLFLSYQPSNCFLLIFEETLFALKQIIRMMLLMWSVGFNIYPCMCKSK